MYSIRLRSWTLFALLAGGAACLRAAVLYSVTDLGGNYTFAYGINNAGQVTGAAGGAYGPGHAFLYSNGGMTDLGTLPGGISSYGYAINRAGQITGTSYAPFGVGDAAFLYSNGVMTDLNSLIDPTLHITLSDAGGINDFGQIVANGSGHAYLLTPVPEPGTWTLLGAGLLLGGAFRRFRLRNGAVN